MDVLKLIVGHINRFGWRKLAMSFLKRQALAISLTLSSVTAITINTLEDYCHPDENTEGLKYFGYERQIYLSEVTVCRK